MHALILVDIQNDFLPGGALAVPDGGQILSAVNLLQRCFKLVVATQDWHPPNHGSFAANHPGRLPYEETTLAGLPQTLWPVHCVQGTPGAEFAPELNREGWARVFQKGVDPEIDSYSGFFDNGHRRSTGLAEFLREQSVTEVWLAGLATDYCVKSTALDAMAQGFATHVVEDACRGVELQTGDVARAWDELRQAGVKIVHAGEVAR